MPLEGIFGVKWIGNPKSIPKEIFLAFEIFFFKGCSKKNQNFEKKKIFLTIWKYQKTIFKTFLRSTLFLFRPLFPKYQHFLALKAYISEMRAEIETVEVAWALLFDFALFSMSFKFFFCNLNFWILTPASEITLQFFSGTPFRSWTFWTYIVTIKYELYQNLGPLRSILRAPEHEMAGGAESAPPCPK